jgi:signal transduction histidine kinase
MSEHDYTILVIDDEVTTRTTLAALLERPNYHVEMAEDGVEGLELAKRIKPDVILLDIMMPRMNGYDVCKRVRQDEEIREVPIILITALDDHDAKLNGLMAGADDFLSKPFDSFELKVRLHTLRHVDRYRRLLEERKKLDKALNDLSEKNRQLSALSRRVLETQETERRLVAMELHDEIGQLLTGLKLILERGQVDAANVLPEARAVTGELMQRTREISLNLRPAALDDLGLSAALDVLFKRFTKRTGIAVIHNIDPLDERRFDRNIETTVFRVTQEALTNVARHAETSEVNVVWMVSSTRLRISIADSGKGFDLNLINATTSTGLSGMAERVNLAGGHFSLQSKPGAGTLILADFELNKEG